MYLSFFKPLLDFFMALSMLLLLSPVFLIICLILLMVNRGKPFFVQARPGKNERIFKILKFRTMSDKTDAKGSLLPPGERLTPIGKIIRKYSLDEIPQLINVIKGEMSLVGPRPLLIRYLPLYNVIQKRRHNVKPGITGWAQVNGRNAISWEKKFEYDLYYVTHVSFLFDLKILALTFIKVFKKQGIYSADNQIMADFTGTNSEAAGL